VRGSSGLHSQCGLLLKEETKTYLKQLSVGEKNEVLRLIREVFLPSLLDPKVPVEFGANDMWMDIDFRGIPADEAKIIALARQDTIKWIIGSLVRLKQLSNEPDALTAAEIAEKAKLDSAK